jgi:hypothetical protein
LARHSALFISEQFEGDDGGTTYEFEGIRVLTNTVDGDPESLKVYQPIGWVGNFDIQDLGDDKELYRWPFLIDSARDRDDYSRLIDMAKAFSLSGDALERAVDEVMDMDNWTETFALMSLFGIGDVYSQGNPHNLNFYVRPSDNKIVAMPWDWDFVFNQGPTAALHGGQNIGKILDLPQYEHLFLGQLHHLIDTVFNREYLARWTDHFGRLLSENYNSLLTNVDNRSQNVLNRLPPRTPFRLGSQDPSGDERVLLGEQVAASALVPLSTNGGDQLGTTWTTPDFVPSTPWLTGMTGVGFEGVPGELAPLIHLNVSAMLGQNSSVFVRVPFTVNEPLDLEQLLLRMKFDDGFVAYLNGVRVAAANAPADLTWNSSATASRRNSEAIEFADFDISDFSSLLRPGENILAIHGMNRSANGSDALFSPQLVGRLKQTGPPPELTVDQPEVTLEGIGWVNVKQIRLRGQSQPLNVRWLSPTTWRTTVPLQQGRNELVLEAVDFSGQVVGQQLVNVTTSASHPIRDYLRISELMYHPADPTAAEQAAGASDADDFEFVELINIAPQVTGQILSLSGVELSGGVQYTLPDVQLAPGQYVVIAKDPEMFRVRYGQQIAVLGPFAEGQLDNSGDHLLLLDAAGSPILDFQYTDQDPWPIAADGDGPSLELIDPVSTPRGSFGDAVRWRVSDRSGGSPGAPGTGSIPGDFNQDGLADLVDLELLCSALPTQDLRFDLNADQQVDRQDVEAMLRDVLDTVYGDVNLDGIFNSSDIVQIFVAGQYEDSIVGNSSWTTGDWNCDGEFTSADFVIAFTAGSYTAGVRGLM